MAVSEKDRAYFRRIAAAKATSRAESLRAHRALPLDERLRRSWELYLAYRETVDLSSRQDDPSPFYERARRLGLYQG